MASPLGFGNLKVVVNNAGPLAGRMGRVFGPRLIAPALMKQGSSYEFGEIVELTSDKEKGYLAEKVDGDSANTGLFGVVYRDQVGSQKIREHIIEAAFENVAASVFLLDATQKGTISVALKGNQPSIGGAVYVGKGTTGTTAGAVYAAAQGGGGADSFALTGYVFKSLGYEPTDTAQKAILIGLA